MMMHNWLALTTIAFSIAAVGQLSQGPPPAPPGQQHEEKAAKDHQVTANQNQPPREAVPSYNQTGAAIKTTGPDSGRDPKAPKPAVDGWLKGNAILVTIFTGFLTLLAGLQWLAMHKQAKLMHAQARLMVRQLAEMKSSGTDTKALSLAATSQLAAIKGAIRARVGVDGVTDVGDVIGLHQGLLPQTIYVYVKNAGFSPALGVGLWGVFSAESKDMSLDDLSEEARVANPSTTINVGEGPRIGIPTARLLPETIDAIKQGDFRMRLYGQVKYEDIFDGRHCMSFVITYLTDSCDWQVDETHG